MHTCAADMHKRGEVREPYVGALAAPCAAQRSRAGDMHRVYCTFVLHAQVAARARPGVVVGASKWAVPKCTVDANALLHCLNLLPPSRPLPLTQDLVQQHRLARQRPSAGVGDVRKVHVQVVVGRLAAGPATGRTGERRACGRQREVARNSNTRWVGRRRQYGDGDAMGHGTHTHGRDVEGGMSAWTRCLGPGGGTGGGGGRRRGALLAGRRRGMRVRVRVRGGSHKRGVTAHSTRR